jgi:hypothetical protein
MVIGVLHQFQARLLLLLSSSSAVKSPVSTSTVMNFKPFRFFKYLGSRNQDLHYMLILLFIFLFFPPLSFGTLRGTKMARGIFFLFVFFYPGRLLFDIETNTG